MNANIKRERYTDFYGFTYELTIDQKNDLSMLTVWNGYKMIYCRQYNTGKGAKIAAGRLSEGTLSPGWSLPG